MLGFADDGAPCDGVAGLVSPGFASAASLRGFRSALDGLGFTEVCMPKLVGGATERLAVTDGHLSRLRWLGGGRDSPQP